MALKLSNFKNHIITCNEIQKSKYCIVKLQKLICRPNNVCICVRRSVYNAKSDKSNLPDEEPENLKSSENKVCVCVKHSDKSSLLDEEPESSNSSEDIICVCIKHSICSDTANVLDEEPENSSSSKESHICVCPKDSLSSSALTEPCATDEKLKELKKVCYASVCKHHTVNRNVLFESISSTTDQSSNESFIACTCPYISTCYDTKESGSLVDQLLNQLPKVRYRNESRKFWEMMVHCERAAFRKSESNLPLPSREARFYWHLYSTAAKHSPLYQKEVNHALQVTLSKLINCEKDKKGIRIWEQLIRLKTFDQIGRKNLINKLVRFVCQETDLEYICLEGLSLKSDEGVRLLSALYNSRKTMRHVYCWRAFEKMINICPRIETRPYEDKPIKKHDWFFAICRLKFLTTLSVNYVYIATPTGDILILLAKQLGPNWQWLQLLCTEEETVQKCDDGMKVINDVIPDAAWKKAHFLAPELKVQYAIVGIPMYDIHKWLFTEHTQIHTFALSTSIDLKFQQPWYLNCTFKTLYSWYSNSLVYLCLQLWHNRENLDNQLKKLFVSLPSLRVFEFIGEIRKLKTLCIMCLQIQSCSSKVHCVNMQLQEVLHDDVDKEKWIKSVKCLLVCFKHDFEELGVKFDIDFYCW